MLSATFENVVVVIVVLGVMVFIHELGHFLAAKYFGIRVLTFSIGFGKRLLGFQKGDTDYRLSLLPFGGYVKMAGENPSDQASGAGDEFFAKPRWQRFIVALMGPVMNGLLAVALLAVLYQFHLERPAYQEQPARVGDVELDSPAAQAGIQAGDRVIQAADLENPQWEDLEIKILTTVNEPIPLTVERAGEILNVSVTPQPSGPNRVGDVGWFPYMPAVLDSVSEGLPASEAGIEPHDEIVAVNGRRIYCWVRLSPLLQKLEGAPLTLTVRRGEREFETTFKPAYRELGGETKWRIGVAFRNDTVVRQLPWRQAWRRSVEDNIRYTRLTFDVLGKMLTRRLSPRSLTGPVGIAQISGRAYRAGLPQLLTLAAFISLQLGIFNLLPIPILDGGVILFLAVESLMRRDMSIKLKERVTMAGLVFLLLFAGFVMYNDILKALGPG